MDERADRGADNRGWEDGVGVWGGAGMETDRKTSVNGVHLTG